MEDLVRYENRQLAIVTTPLPDKVTLELTRGEWQELTNKVNWEHTDACKIPNKYKRAIVLPLIKAVFVKLHNKLHSLKDNKNKLNLTLPEASVLATALLKLGTENYLTVTIIGVIDQKLT